MGDGDDPLRVDFDRRIKRECRGSTVTRQPGPSPTGKSMTRNAVKWARLSCRRFKDNAACGDRPG